MNFFNWFKSKKVIPAGLTNEKNLGTHVIDEDIIGKYKKVLYEASSRSLDLDIKVFKDLEAFILKVHDQLFVPEKLRSSKSWDYY